MPFGLKKVFGKDQGGDDYLEIDVHAAHEKKSKVLVRPFTLKQYDDINEIITALREGLTIAVIDIKPIKTKDVIELKRAIAKIKKTVEAMEGSIAGFGENVIIATPQFAEVFKSPVSVASGPKKDSLEFY